jgi:hypothetical protein
MWVPEEEVSLGTKSISANGTYKASDDGKYGFSQVTVNVSGGQGSVNPDGTPNISPIDPNDPDSKVNPGGTGTSVVGTDPVTGNDYVIGVDEDGKLVTTPVPSRIEITESPTKIKPRLQIRGGEKGQGQESGNHGLGCFSGKRAPCPWLRPHQALPVSRPPSTASPPPPATPPGPAPPSPRPCTERSRPF